MTRSPNTQRLVPCMPPLLDEETEPLGRFTGDTEFGGTACELEVKKYFLSKCINIAEPHVDVGVDLLIEKPEEGWVRGQVKKVVYHLHKDYGIFKKSGREVYRSRFSFNFQQSKKVSHLKNGRNQKSPKDFDYFYHVLLTSHRQLIWETPVNIIPTREDGTFVFGKTPCLDRDNWKRKPADIDFNKYLVYHRYDPIIFKTYPDFFLKPEPQTLENFFA